MSNFNGFQAFVINQDRADKIRKMQELNVPDDVITEARLEWKGGNCPKCGIAYQKEHSHNVGVRDHRGNSTEKTFSDFYYYKAQCQCLSKIGQDRDKKETVINKIAEAGIPEVFKEVEFYSWDYSVDEGATNCMKKALDLLETGDFSVGFGVVLCGSPGRGKTNLGICMMRWLIQNTTKSLLFLPMSEIIGRIIHGGKTQDYETELMLYDIILMDDIDKIHTQSEWVRTKVFNILDGMLRKKKQVIITTNFITVSEFTEKFDNAVESRLVGGCEFILFPPGEDYRKVRKLRELKTKNQETLF